MTWGVIMDCFDILIIDKPFSCRLQSLAVQRSIFNGTRRPVIKHRASKQDSIVIVNLPCRVLVLPLRSRALLLRGLFWLILNYNLPIPMMRGRVSKSVVATNNAGAGGGLHPLEITSRGT